MPATRPAAHRDLLAIGISLPGDGMAPGLVATMAGAGTFIRSRSPMLLEISTNSRYGQLLHKWTTLQLGGTTARVVVTGRRYGYCFSQAAGDGYAATRGCGTLIMHQMVDGARLPDGAAATSYFYFLRRG